MVYQARWNDTVIAESDDIVTVEGNPYFPLDSLKSDYFSDSDTTSRCPWKGQANYLHITVGGDQNPDAAWTYRSPKPDAEQIRDRIAFWRGVTITQS